MQLQNNVYILSSRSGLGKSAFAQHIINSVKNKYPAIKVCIPVGDNISIDEGFYIRETAKTLSDQAIDFGYESLNEYLRSTNNPIVKKIWTHKLIKDAEGINGIVKPINSMISYFDKTGDFSEFGLLNVDNAGYIFAVLIEYLAYVCNGTSKIVINIENIQQIDKASLIQIKALLQKVDNLFLLLEYTSVQDSLNEAKRFEQNFYIKGVSVFTKKLEKLNYRYTCELLNLMCPNSSNSLGESQYREIFFTIDGNIRQLSDIENIYELSSDFTKVDTSENFTMQRIRSLSNAHQIQILCLIYAHMSQVSNNSLKSLLNQKSYVLFIKYENLVSDLMGESGLLELDYTENRVRLKHDSIRAVIKDIPKFASKIALSYSWWIEHYEKALKSSDIYGSGKEDIVKKLCYFYSQYEPAAMSIIELLPYIREIVLNSVNPDEAVSFLIRFYDMFKNMKNNQCMRELELFLLKIYYEAGIFDKAYNVYKNMSFNSKKTQTLYNIMLMERLNMEEEAISIIDDELRTVNDKHYELILLLIKMIATASCNKYDECFSIFKLIERYQSTYSSFFEFGFFLRNSEIVLGLEEAIPYLNKSVEFFKNNKQHIYEAHSRISLIMNYSRLGYFEEAEKHLIEAKKILKHNSLERHVLLNDEVAFKMCSGDFSIELEDDLKLAMCTAETVFDKIVINHNLLILCKKNNQRDEGVHIVEYLLELLDVETNKLNICFTYWDISYFYKGFDDVQYSYYYSKYYNMYKELTDKAIRKSVLEKDVYHKPNMEFVIEFISYWHFPITDNL